MSLLGDYPTGMHADWTLVVTRCPTGNASESGDPRVEKERIGGGLGSGFQGRPKRGWKRVYARSNKAFKRVSADDG